MKTRKILTGVLALSMVLTCTITNLPETDTSMSITASAEVYEALNYDAYDDHVEITGFAEETADLVIPAEINGLPVTKIGYYAFEGCENLQSVSIPDSVTHIDTSAFQNCTKLAEVTLGSGLTEISASAFAGCVSLVNIVIPDSVTSLGLRSVFNGCTSLQSVTLSNQLTKVPEQTFADCTSLTAVTIPASCAIVEKTAFKDCTSLAELIIEDGVAQISVDGSSNSGAFENCTALTSVVIPDSVTTIGDYAFRGCVKLADVTIGENVNSIGAHAFRECKSLKSITMPDSVKTMGSYAFADCLKLSDITFSANLAALPERAFSGCTGLTSVTVPGNCVSIGGGAFEDCTNLKEVILEEGVGELVRMDGWYVGTFAGCTALETIQIPASMYEIDEYTFKDCAALTDVYFTGTQSEWETLSIGTNNDSLLNANVTFGAYEPSVIEPGDVNADGVIDAIDAALILRYAAYVGAGGTESITDWMLTLA